MTPKELLEKRAKLISDARTIVDKADEENRELSAEERELFDKAYNEAKDLKTQAEQLTADAERRTALETEETRLAESRGRQTQTQRSDAGSRQQAADQTIELRTSVCGDSRAIVLAGETATDEYARDFRRFLVSGEHRALQQDDPVAGGFLSAPQRFQAELIQALDNAVFMRQIARVLPPLTSGESLGAPSLDADPADPDWTVELGIGSEDSTMAFGKREMRPHPLAKLIKVSKTLLRRSTMSVDGIVRSRLGYKFGVTQENAFLNGTGAQQPLGIFTASDNGIPTSRDVSTGNTATEIRFDGLKECEYSLKGGYRRNASWIFHRDAVKQISKLKTGEGEYIWQPSIVLKDPDRILNIPVQESEYAPNTFTSALYVGALGDFRYYWIVDALTMTIQVLLELYAATNQNGYIGRLECDGMPVLGEAFARVKLA